jgi:histidine ammonia-lyase
MEHQARITKPLRAKSKDLFMPTIRLNTALTWQQVTQIAIENARLELSEAARERLTTARDIVGALIDNNIRAYGVNTGVGGLSDVTISLEQQAKLSRNILMSHAAGIGEPLTVSQTRAIMVAAINNFAHGASGIRLCVVERMVALLNAGLTPLVPHQGSVGYISHMAQLGLCLIGFGKAVLGGETMSVAEAHARLGLTPLVLEAKEGLCLVNGTPCATGLGSLAIASARQAMEWADAIACMSFETQRCQLSAIAPQPMALRKSHGLNAVAETMNHWLEGSTILQAAAGRKTQDALSLRAIPHVHGAIFDSWSNAADVVNQELASVTDNPVVAGTVLEPLVFSQAHAVGASMGLAMDQLATALAQLGMISERRLDRMVNPLVSGLPAFLAQSNGVESGFMIAQYSAASLVGENRRLAAPASLDGGITSGLQEDILCHATPAAIKALDIVRNTHAILAIEYLAAVQSYDLLEKPAIPAPRLRPLYENLRKTVHFYADDRPIGDDIAATITLMQAMPLDDSVSRL